MNNNPPSHNPSPHISRGHGFPAPCIRRRAASPVSRITRSEGGFADESAALLCLIGLVPVPLAFILADVFGLGTLGTVLAAIGLMVLAVLGGAFVLSPRNRGLDTTGLGAIRDVLITPPAAPDPDAKVRPATLSDADAMVTIQWEGSQWVLGEGRPYRRFGAFDAAMRVWLTMALASEDWEVLVEVSDGEVTAWAALDKSGAQGRAWPGPPPRRRFSHAHEGPQ